MRLLWKITLILILLPPVLSGIYHNPASFRETKSASMKMKSEVKVIAHRGAWKKEGLPQNSIASLRNAISIKADGSEFDVRITSDDSLVINHDSKYHGMVIEKTPYSELCQYMLANGEKIPTLREYLTEGIRKKSTTRLICELKASGISRERNLELAGKCIATAEKTNATNHIVWISFDYDIVKRIIELMPKAEVFYLNGDMAPSDLKKAGITGAGYNYSVFRKKPEWIDEAKREGVLLNVWTVNSPEEMDWFIAKEFDYITTDEPELLQSKIN